MAPASVIQLLPDTLNDMDLAIERLQKLEVADGGEVRCRWRRSLPVEVAQGFQILLQVLGIKVGGDPAEPENLPEFPEGQACQLMSLAQREPALRIEMDRQLDEELVRRQAC